eukprot:6072265-Ditylum_brightwellii.AAC.1
MIVPKHESFPEGTANIKGGISNASHATSHQQSHCNNGSGLCARQNGGMIISPRPSTVFTTSNGVHHGAGSRMPYQVNHGGQLPYQQHPT